jgi:hypothetical protein
VKEARHSDGLVLAMQEEQGMAINRFLLHCEVARDLWVSISLLFGLEWVICLKGGGVDGVLERSTFV